jgi:post-segregation antitoxin (ccd killing protein)
MELKEVTRVKKGYVRVAGEIPIETYEAIKAYNNVSKYPLNISRLIEQSLIAEVKKIQEEAKHTQNDKNDDQ